MMKNDITEFGIQVKKKLLELDMTQRRLANEVGIDEKFLSAILRGIRPGYEYREKITNVLEKHKRRKALQELKEKKETA